LDKYAIALFKENILDKNADIVDDMFLGLI
jgi:hypothetical protein